MAGADYGLRLWGQWPFRTPCGLMMSLDKGSLRVFEKGPCGRPQLLLSTSSGDISLRDLGIYVWPLPGYHGMAFLAQCGDHALAGVSRYGAVTPANELILRRKLTAAGFASLMGRAPVVG